VNFVGYLYIMDSITMCISVKHVCGSVLPMLMCLWWGCVCATEYRFN